MLWEHGATAAGEIHAEGVVAPGIAMQVDPEALNVLKVGSPLFNSGQEREEPPDLTEVEVPIGEPGGPLAGSSLTGAIPEELVSPEEPPVEPEEPPPETEPPPEGGRAFPIGPVSLVLVEDDPDGIALTVPTGTDVQVGDTVLVEATTNTGVNGSYAVLSIDGDRIVVDNPYELTAPLEAKGRLTVTSGA
jgi:hypothetical protein